MKKPRHSGMPLSWIKIKVSQAWLRTYQIERRLEENRVVAALRRVIGTAWFGRAYVIFALVILFASTTLWALLGARLNMQNADQLVNAYLFEKPSTFHAAVLPASHSFLLKWPLFWLIKSLGYTQTSYIGVTLVSVLLTVAALAFILGRIERRPLAYGTIILALSSTLLLVPTSAYAGALLPVNMAMLATRNIEYIVYIAAVFLLVSVRRIGTIKLWVGVLLLAILAASDKLFLWMSLGGAGLALTVYGLTKGWNLVSTSARWMLGALLGGVVAAATIWLLGATHITHFASQAAAAPYGLAATAHDIALGCVYGAVHMLTNFGANPAAQTPTLTTVPHTAATHLFSMSGLAYILNLFVFILLAVAAIRIVRRSIAHNKDKTIPLDGPAKVSIALIWTSLAALVLFIASKHYYAADARYLTIFLFGAYIAGATFISHKQPARVVLVISGVALLAGMLLAIPGRLHAYHQNVAALAPTAHRNSTITAVLAQHHVETLVGDYWRVIPIRQQSSNHIAVTPLISCTAFRDTLSSHAWQPNLRKTSFAYLLSLDGSLTDYPHCSLAEVIAAYGRPDSSIVVAGDIAHPQELLLFYDHGAHPSTQGTLPTAANSFGPLELSDLPNTACKQPTLMNIVAHEDDDLLFMNPDLQTALRTGHCVRTIYITAGDAGANMFYWLSREQGSQAAYATMLGIDDAWQQHTVHLSGNRYATVATLRGNQQVTLIFLHLPDGNLHGQGFSIHNNESLAALDHGKIKVIHDVYNNAPYSRDDLVGTLTAFLQAYQPSAIHTLSNYVSTHFPDHSDHMAVSRIVQSAYDAYETEHFDGLVIIPLQHYIGYPVHEMPVNVVGSVLREKEKAFAAYSHFDPGVCRSMMLCRADPAYGTYLPKQYQNAY